MAIGKNRFKQTFCSRKCYLCEYTKTESYREKQRLSSANRYKNKHDDVMKASLKYRENNRAKIAKRTIDWQKKNPEKVKAIAKKGRIKNSKKISECYKIYYENNKDTLNKYRSDWRKRNKGLMNSYANKRRALKLKCTPSYANMGKIAEIYKRAAELTVITGIPHHVDHIIPLQGKTVTGLHHEDNLQILEATENLKKSNKLIC